MKRRKVSKRGGARPGAGRPGNAAPAPQPKDAMGIMMGVANHGHHLLVHKVAKAFVKCDVAKYLRPFAPFLVSCMTCPRTVDAITLAEGTMNFWRDIQLGEGRKHRIHTLELKDGQVSVAEELKSAVTFAHLFARDSYAFIEAVVVIAKTMERLAKSKPFVAQLLDTKALPYRPAKTLSDDVRQFGFGFVSTKTVEHARSRARKIRLV